MVVEIFHVIGETVVGAEVGRGERRESLFESLVRAWVGSRGLGCVIRSGRTWLDFGSSHAGEAESGCA